MVDSYELWRLSMPLGGLAERHPASIETCLDITGHIVEASEPTRQSAEFTAASSALVRARVLVRLARAVHCVLEAQHDYMASW